MSERMWLDEQLEKARTERDEAIRQSQGYLKCARECLDERDALRARVAKLEAALTALADRIDEIDADPSFRGLFSLAYAHGAEYRGPNCGEQLQAARAALDIGPL